MLDGGTNLLPSMRWRAKGISQGYVFSVGEQLLHGFGVSFHEHVQRLLILVDQLINIVYGRHLEITSTVDALSFPRHPAFILRYSPECVEDETLLKKSALS